MWRYLCLAGLLCTVATTAIGETPLPVPTHERPYFMPEWRRQEILKQIRTEAWAQEAYAQTKAAADKGDGYWAAFLYALEGEPKYLDIAQKWLLQQNGPDAYETKRLRQCLDDPNTFVGPEKGELGLLWYGLEFKQYATYDWVYKALPPEARDAIHAGLRARAEFRMRALDAWTTTPNLVFKPLTMIAFAGLTLGDEDIQRWGFQRTVRQGTYYTMLDRLLLDGQVWNEACIYPIYHKDLWCMDNMSFYRRLFDGKEWYSAKAPGGGSPKGLMDYYLDTAYPIERTSDDKGRIRIATYGDGSTHLGGDAFLSHLSDEVILSYAVSRDPRYAPFVAMIPRTALTPFDRQIARNYVDLAGGTGNTYTPNLWDHPPLPKGDIPFPPASSHIWPDFGLAMLRSDETPNYWTNPNSIAVQQILTKRYGHDQPDKFHISLFGANRLLYPDILPIQYERQAVGWAYTSANHNTMLVDEQDTRSAPPNIRQEFAPEVKFLATSASGLFEGVDQTRALLLTPEYLLDLFQAASKVPHTYDYVLHSLGMPRPLQPEAFQLGPPISPRYFALDAPQTATFTGSWGLEFTAKAPQPKEPNPDFDAAYYAHEAHVRVTMAADTRTQVCTGTWGPGNFEQRAAIYYPGWKWKPDIVPNVGMLVARRTGCRNTVFASTHEPFANAAVPKIKAITKLAECEQAMVVRVDADGFTDYAAVAWGTDAKTVHTLTATDDPKQVFVFSNYAFLRVPRNGTVLARGGWAGFRLPGAGKSMRLNGKARTLSQAAGYLAYGKLPKAVPAILKTAPECPLTIKTPPLTRLRKPGEGTVTLSINNTLTQPVSGHLEFALPSGVTVKPEHPPFGPIPPGQSVDVAVGIVAGPDAVEGRHTLPFRVVYATPGSAEIPTQYQPLTSTIGVSVETDFTGARGGVLLANTPYYTVKVPMFSTCMTYLADPDGTVRLDGNPLFTFTDENGKPVIAPDLLAENLWFNSQSFTVICSNHYIVYFKEDRIVAPGWRGPQQVSLKEARFTIPGEWISPGGAPRWKRIIAVDAQGKEFDAQPGQGEKIAAAELEFPGARWNLAFNFSPPQPVRFDDTKMQFPIHPFNETVAVGFCAPGTLEDWRKK